MLPQIGRRRPHLYIATVMGGRGEIHPNSSHN